MPPNFFDNYEQFQYTTETIQKAKNKTQKPSISRFLYSSVKSVTMSSNSIYTTKELLCEHLT